MRHPGFLRSLSIRRTLMTVAVLAAFAASAAADVTWTWLDIGQQSTSRYYKAVQSSWTSEYTDTYWGSRSAGIHLTLTSADSGFTGSDQIRCETRTGLYLENSTYSSYMSAWGRVTGALASLPVTGTTVPVRVVIDSFHSCDSNYYMNIQGYSTTFGTGTATIKDWTTGQTLLTQSLGGVGQAGFIVDLPKDHVVALELESISDLLAGTPTGIIRDLDVTAHLEWGNNLTRGMLQEYAVMPTATLPAGGFAFTNQASGSWFDPPVVDALTYRMTGASLFTEIESFPTGFSSTMHVLADGQDLGAFGPGGSVDFVALLGHGVSQFKVQGIDPAVDAADPMGFPLQLAFDTATADFEMTPEPATLTLLALGAAGTLLRRRR